MARGSIRRWQLADVPAEMLVQARLNCATMAENRGEGDLAASFIDGGQDKGWSIRHEVARLIAEAAKGSS